MGHGVAHGPVMRSGEYQTCPVSLARSIQLNHHFPASKDSVHPPLYFLDTTFQHHAYHQFDRLARGLEDAGVQGHTDADHLHNQRRGLLCPIVDMAQSRHMAWL